jgi:hypothetical protein
VFRGHVKPLTFRGSVSALMLDSLQESNTRSNGRIHPAPTYIKQ